MGINKSIKEAQYLNSILKTLQEQMSDQVVWNDLWQNCGMSPERSKNVVQPVTLIVMCMRVKFIWASNTALLFMILSVKYLSRAQPVTKDA